MVWLFHPHVVKAAVALPHRPHGPNGAAGILQACVITVGLPWGWSGEGVQPIPIPIPAPNLACRVGDYPRACNV